MLPICFTHLLASVEGTTLCLEIPLQSPSPRGRPSLGDRLPPPPGRPSHATQGVCKGGGGYILACGKRQLIPGKPNVKVARGARARAQLRYSPKITGANPTRWLNVGNAGSCSRAPTVTAGRRGSHGAEVCPPTGAYSLPPKPSVIPQTETGTRKYFVSNTVPHPMHLTRGMSLPRSSHLGFCGGLSWAHRGITCRFELILGYLVIGQAHGPLSHWDCFADCQLTSWTCCLTCTILLHASPLS